MATPAYLLTYVDFKHDQIDCTTEEFVMFSNKIPTLKAFGRILLGNEPQQLDVTKGMVLPNLKRIQLLSIRLSTMDGSTFTKLVHAVANSFQGLQKLIVDRSYIINDQCEFERSEYERLFNFAHVETSLQKIM
ncbi:hypothetical protein HDU76_006894 [Blyttiomyces sp. JEL0837]|nr:hypothetical protein HDU76_006894 [Blyttiomyces sp. JEL0837]